MSAPKIICALDIGGTNAKARCAHWSEKRATPSGPNYTPEQLATDLAVLLAGEKIDAITIGLPTPIKDGRPLMDPVNLGPGWKDFDYRKAFGVPVKILNDAAMQAIGSHRAAGLTNEKMLFLGLGTGLGSCMVVGRNVLPMELAHLPFKKGKSFEDYVGVRGRELAAERRRRREAWGEVLEEAREEARGHLSIDLPAPEAVIPAARLKAIRDAAAAARDAAGQEG